MAEKTAEMRARELMSKHWAGYPVDPWLIADREGLEVRYSSTLPDDVAGVIARESPESPIIVMINRNDSLRRPRFTLAHELGHYTKLKDEGRINNRLGFVEHRDELSSQGTDPIEIDANKFAAELLMPAEAIRIWSKGGTVFNAVQNILDVSKEALLNRYKTLGIPYV